MGGRESLYWRRIHRGRWRAVRAQALQRDGYRCQTCGKAGRLEVDHVVALSRGGAPYDLGNLAARCVGCHAAKTRREHPHYRPRSPEQRAWAVVLASLGNDQT